MKSSKNRLLIWKNCVFCARGSLWATNRWKLGRVVWGIITICLPHDLHWVSAVCCYPKLSRKLKWTFSGPAEHRWPWVCRCVCVRLCSAEQTLESIRNVRYWGHWLLVYIISFLIASVEVVFCSCVWKCCWLLHIWDTRKFSMLIYLLLLFFFSVFCWENLNKIRNRVELQDFMFAQMPFFSNIIITLFNSLVD